MKAMNKYISVCKKTVIVYEHSMKFTLGQGGHIVVVQRPPKRRNKSLVYTPRHDLVKARKCLQSRSGFVNIFSTCLDKVSFSCNNGFAEGGQGSSGKGIKRTPLGETIIA